MTLNNEERDIVVLLRLQRARETLAETKGLVNLGHWHGAANRLYYACFYAVSGLLVQNGHIANTHSGVVGLLGKYFVVSGIITTEENKLYRKLFELRQSSDYSDWMIVEEKDIVPLIKPAEQFITRIEKLTNSK